MLGLALLSGWQTGGTGSGSQKSDRWRGSRGSGRGWQEALPGSSSWNGVSPSSQAIFSLPRPAASGVLKSVIRGERVVWAEKSGNDSLHPQHEREGGTRDCSWRELSVRLTRALTCLVTQGGLVQLSKPLLLPLRNEEAAPAFPWVLGELNETGCARSAAPCLHVVTA